MRLTPSRESWPLVVFAVAGILVAASVYGIGHLVAGEGQSAVVFAPSAPARSDIEDRAAQSDLRNAMVAARSHYVDAETYSSFDRRTASSIEPFLTWSEDRPAEPGVVSINFARETGLVMSTRSRSGRAFCIADEAASFSYGVRDAFGVASPAECSSPIDTL